MKTRTLIIAVACLLFASQFSFGAGFALYEGGARGNVLGGLTGHGDDPSAVFYNPAGITHLEGSHFMAGVTLIAPYADLDLTNAYTGATRSADLTENVFTPPHIYYTRQLSEKLWLGLGFFSRFGLGTEYDRDWDGRYSNIETTIETVQFNANLAYKFNDKVSVAFGINSLYFSASLESAIDATLLTGEPHNNPDTSALDVVQHIEDDTFTFGFNAAIHYTPSDRWGFGLTYNSGMDVDLKGVAAFTKSSTLPPTWFVDANVELDTIELPEMWFLGFHYIHNDKFSLGGGAVLTTWGDIPELVFNYETPIVVAPGLGVALDSAVRHLEWEDTWRYNLGFEYKYNERATFMWGFIYDETPIPDETISYLLPTNSRRLVNLGLSYQLGEWLAQVGYDYLVIGDRHIESRQLEEGVLESEVSNAGAHLLGLSLSKKF